MTAQAEDGPDAPTTSAFDRYQQEHRWLGFPIAVVYKYADDSGGYLAALIAYYAFLSLFPLLLLLTTILAFVLRGDVGLQNRILDSALAQFPVIGTQLGDPKHLGGGPGGIAIGIIGSLYGGLGVAQAVQYAMNTAWSVPRNNRPNPFKARGRSLLLLGGPGLALVGTTALATIGAGGAGSFDEITRVLVIAASVVVNAAVFVLAFKIATARDVTARDVLPGALAGAVVWQLLQTFGVIYVSSVVRHASQTNGVFAIVLGLLAFLYITAASAVLCVEINVVRVQRLFPRSLLTPFTDDVVLTRGDRRAYTREAKAQRSKGFQTITVDFDQEEPPAK